MRKLLICTAVAFCSVLCVACGNPEPEDPTPTPDEPIEVPVIELALPADNAVIELSEDSELSFKWYKIDGTNNYKLALSMSKDMKSAYTVPALTNPLTFTGKEFDKTLEDFGVGKGETVDLFWSIIPYSDRVEAESQVRSIKVTRIPLPPEPEDRNADPITIKVGVLYEDMIVTSQGKRLHECCGWANPHKQVLDMAKFMSESSHGVVNFEIAVEIESEKPHGYLYYHDPDKRTAVTADMCYEYKETGFTSTQRYPEWSEDKGDCYYDYPEMIKDHGFLEMINNGEVDEIWVYNHPACGMWEACMGGPGAFWINGGTFNVAGLSRKVSVMYCNYERTVDLAMHSYAHRTENVMKTVYGGRWEYNVAAEKNLNNWERFSAYNMVYDKYDKGTSHIGNCHFPCNAVADYSYESRTYVKSYCDAWENYPDLKLENPRMINCSEWGSTQLGYMKWFFGHLPHFRGINTDRNDYHLNNWWYYIVDYDGAMKYERKLVNEL